MKFKKVIAIAAAAVIAVTGIGIVVNTAITTSVVSVIQQEEEGNRDSEGGSGEDLVRVALSQVGNVGGQPYWSWYGFAARQPWCACFVSWCANECGLIDQGLIPKYAYCPNGVDWFKQRGQWKDNTYTPRAGDIVFFDWGGDGVADHTGIVHYGENGVIVTVEGNTSDRSSGNGDTCQQRTRSPGSVMGYGTPNYDTLGGGGVDLRIPEPYGTVYSYMGWQLITAPSSKQYQLKQQAGMNFDANGFGKIYGRYVIACTTTFGDIGDYIDFTLDNGTVIKTVIGDIKNQNDPGCNIWGHQNGACVIEFVVDKNSWYGTSRYPTNFHPEWAGRPARAKKAGSYW